jgi:hypothetical protein
MPLDAAVDYLDSWLQMLHFNEQRTICRELSLESLKLFVPYFIASKNILKAECDVANYWPNNCMVKFPFQPVDGIKEDPTYKTLDAEVSDLTKETKLRLGRLHSPHQGACS